MSCGELFLKGASSTFTGYFLIVSVAFIFYGLTTALYLLKTNTIETLDEELVAVPSLCLLFFGVILLLVIILGCCAVCREIPCCLETYSILLSLLAACQIGLGIFCLIRFSVNNVDFQSRIYDDVYQTFLLYEEAPKQMDTTQDWMKCCGFSELGPADWLRNGTIPPSCCDSGILNCTVESGNVYSDGCSLKLYSYIVGTNYIIGLTMIVTAVTELIGAVMGIGLSCAFWRNSRVMWI